MLLLAINAAIQTSLKRTFVNIYSLNNVHELLQSSETIPSHRLLIQIQGDDFVAGRISLLSLEILALECLERPKADASLKPKMVATLCPRKRLDTLPLTPMEFGIFVVSDDILVDPIIIVARLNYELTIQFKKKTVKEYLSYHVRCHISPNIQA